MDEQSIERIAQKLGARRICIEEIAASEAEGKELIGIAYGQDLFHCIYLGRHSGESFNDRARWYYVNPVEDDILKELRKVSPGSVRIDFYG